MYNVLPGGHQRFYINNGYRAGMSQIKLVSISRYADQQKLKKKLLQPGLKPEPQMLRLICDMFLQ